MENKIKEYVAFKLKQYSRINGLTTKEEMSLAMKVNVKSWVAEAIQVVGV